MATHSSILVCKIPRAGAKRAAVSEVTESDVAERQLSYFSFYLFFHQFLSLHAYFCIFSSNYTISSLILFSTVSHLPLNPSTKFLILCFPSSRIFILKILFISHLKFSTLSFILSVWLFSGCLTIPRVAVILFLLSNT